MVEVVFGEYVMDGFFDSVDWVFFEKFGVGD